MKISIVMPAHNEEKRIGKTLEDYGKFFMDKKRNKEIEGFEIIVVINNTQDRTEEIVEKCRKKHKEIRYLSFRQGGKGFAISEGFKEALKKDFDLIGFVDADMATPPEAYYNLVKNIGNYDGCIASRAIPGSKVYPKQSLIRRFASRVFNFLTRVLFLMRYRDTQCGAKIFKRRSVQMVIGKLGMTRWAFDVDILYKMNKLKFRIKEVPTVWRDVDFSKLNVKKQSIQMLLAIIQLRILNSPLKKSWRVISPFAGLLWRMAK